MFYVVYRGDAPTFKINASTKMFKTRELAAAHAEGYHRGRNAVVVEGPECLLPGGTTISFGKSHAEQHRLLEKPVEKFETVADFVIHAGNRAEDGAGVSIPTHHTTDMTPPEPPQTKLFAVIADWGCHECGGNETVAVCRTREIAEREKANYRSQKCLRDEEIKIEEIGFIES
jgi:hypothetical protein